MDTWVSALHSRAAVLQQQIALAMEAQRTQGVQMEGFISAYQLQLQELYSEDLPLAMLKDTSDIILHAEGPAARHHAAGTSAVAWLCQEAERRVRQLGLASLKLGRSDFNAAEKDLRVLLNGLAPGSLYLGFSVDSAVRMASNQEDLDIEHAEGSDTLTAVRKAVRTLPMVPHFVGDEGVDLEMTEVFADADMRDAMLMAAYHLSPTGKRGIHTIEISAPRSQERAGIFTNRERTVLRESVLLSPMLRNIKYGSFVGQLREVDLDARRFTLRDVPDVGSIRCVIGELSADTARKLIGHGARVFGEYEADRDGKPRLMRVETIEPYQMQAALNC